MTDIYKIDIEFQNSDYSKVTLIANREYSFACTYSDLEDCFYFSLSSLNEILLQNIKLVSGIDLFVLKVSANTPKGELYLYDLDKKSNPRLGRDANWENFGSRVLLVFEEKLND